jgi:hypothetical protein
MINPVASSSIPDAAQLQSAASAAKSPAKPAQDSVQLSKQALSAGDVDHDGDSH